MASRKRIKLTNEEQWHKLTDKKAYYVYINVWLTDTCMPDTNIYRKKTQNRKHGIYIQYTLSQSPYRNYTAVNSNLKIGDQIQQGMSWHTAGQ